MKGSERALTWIVSVVLLFIFLITIPSAAAENSINLQEMTTEELLDLKTALIAELLSRPESEDIVFAPGTYIVGKDILPGTYFAMSDFGYYTLSRAYVYADETKNDKLFEICCYERADSIEKLELNEGNLLVIDVNSLKLSKSGFPEFIIPDGTKVGTGVYVVGIDIPEGKYKVQYAGHGDSSIWIYKDREQYENNSSSNYIFYTRLKFGNTEAFINLISGQYLKIDHDYVIMKTAAMMQID